MVTSDPNVEDDLISPMGKKCGRHGSVVALFA